MDISEIFIILKINKGTLCAVNVEFQASDFFYLYMKDSAPLAPKMESWDQVPVPVREWTMNIIYVSFCDSQRPSKCGSLYGTERKPRVSLTYDVTDTSGWAEKAHFYRHIVCSAIQHNLYPRGIEPTSLPLDNFFFIQEFFRSENLDH